MEGPECGWLESMTETALVQITPQQMQAARLLLGWSRERLAMFAETSGDFVVKYETQGRVMTMYSRERSFDGLAAIRAALEAAGVEFNNGGEPGVRLKRQPE